MDRRKTMYHRLNQNQRQVNKQREKRQRIPRTERIDERTRRNYSGSERQREVKRIKEQRKPKTQKMDWRKRKKYRGKQRQRDVTKQTEDNIANTND